MNSAWDHDTECGAPCKVCGPKGMWVCPYMGIACQIPRGEHVCPEHDPASKCRGCGTHQEKHLWGCPRSDPKP